MRKTLWPLAWSPSTNVAFERPVYRKYITGIYIQLQVTGNQPDKCFNNQLQDHSHRG